jgi:spermidine synthase
MSGLSLPREVPFARQLLAIALASFAVLFFQIAITRVLSVVLWYHWAFLSISLAMLGLGAPGVWFALRPPPRRLLAWLLGLGGLSVPAAVCGVLWIGNRFGAWSVLPCMACLLVPFLLLGAAVCQLLMAARGSSVGRMYGADLLGAALAAALVLPALIFVPTPTAAGGIGALPLLAALLVGGSRLVVGAAIAGVVALCLWGEPFAVRRSKSYDETVVKPTYVRWTPTARLSFFDVGKSLPGFGWGFGAQAPKVPVAQYWMEQDGSAGTPITQFDGDVSDMSELEFLFHDVTTVGYQVRPPKRVAVIGGGGGRDILSALLAKATHIDAVELNYGVVDTLTTRLRAFSGNIYHAPGVHVHVSEGRSYLTRSAGNYDCIQISLIDSWAATAAGAYSLSENNLYTVEAYKLYLDRLAPDGFVSTSRWILGDNRIELFRLLFLNQQALRENGAADPNAHTAVVKGGQVATVITSKRPLHAAEVERLRTVCAEREFELLYPNEANPSPADVPTLLAHGPGPLEAHGLTMRPPTDDRPFFFQSFPVLSAFDTDLARQFGVNAMSVRSLQWLMGVLLVVTLALFFAPFALRRALPRGGEFWRGSLYFAAIGLAFMLIEVPWLQRLVLFVGHPSVAATVTIGALLLGAGVGALCSERTGLRRGQALWFVAPLLLAASNAAMPAVFDAALGWSEPARIGLTIAWLLPIGFALGHFFPLGMLRFGDEHKAWYWALNGACGVLASVCSLALAMAFGFSSVAWMGVGCYVAAGLLLGGRR